MLFMVLRWNCPRSYVLPAFVQNQKDNRKNDNSWNGEDSNDQGN
jgi:hypothetical protein